MERSRPNHRQSLRFEVIFYLNKKIFIKKLYLISFAMLGVYDELKERINLWVNGAANKDT
jgi:hypothetical protein